MRSGCPQVLVSSTKRLRSTSNSRKTHNADSFKNQPFHKRQLKLIQRHVRSGSTLSAKYWVVGGTEKGNDQNRKIFTSLEKNETPQTSIRPNISATNDDVNVCAKGSALYCMLSTDKIKSCEMITE